MYKSQLCAINLFPYKYIKFVPVTLYNPMNIYYDIFNLCNLFKTSSKVGTVTGWYSSKEPIWYKILLEIPL
jgi:hypothetical protein